MVKKNRENRICIYKKRGTLYKTGSQYTTKENITKGKGKSQVFELM